MKWERIVFLKKKIHTPEREENLKYWKKYILNFIFFNIQKIYKKFKQHSINIKNYTAHPHDMVHIPAKFRENTSMRFWVTVRKLNVTDGQTDRRTDRRTDRQTDGGHCNISRPGPSVPREIKTLKSTDLLKTDNYGLTWGMLFES